ncbi:MAG: nicotinate-nicotinamide nucleotide adenylyltransferase, partial [Bacteroidota bacterium]
LAALRPGSPLVVPDALRPWAARIHAFAPPALDISSTAIRDRLRRGISVRYLVPAEVGRYLEASGLYRPGGRV